MWIVVWVILFSWRFTRLLRLYDISPLAALAGLSFVLFNPMLSEVQIWFGSSFCLCALVLTIEGIIQWELALRQNRSVIHWIFAAFLGVIAPLVWTLGYIVSIYYLIITLQERKRLKSLLGCGITLTISFLGYPLIRGFSAMTIGYDAVEIKPLDILSLWKALSKIIGDGLILGSLGFWEVPHNGIKHAGRFLNVLSAIVVLGLGYLAVKREWRKQSCLILAAFVLGFGVPFLFRGSQTSYEGIKWYLRYFAQPVFGGAFLISIFAQIAISKYPRARLGCLFGMMLMVLVSFGDKMPEYYARGSMVKKLNLQPAQVEQFKFLDKFFSVAQKSGLKGISNYYYFPVEGGFYSFNALDLFDSGLKSEHTEIIPEGLGALDALFTDADVWKSYSMFSSAPEVSAFLLRCPWDTASPSIDFVKSAKHKTFEVTGSSRELSYELKTSQMIYQMFWEIRSKGQKNQRIQFTFEFDKPQPVSRSVVVSCDKSPCVFQLPMERLVWIPREPIKRIKLNILNTSKQKQPFQFTTLRAGAVLYPVRQRGFSKQAEPVVPFTLKILNPTPS